MASLAQRLQTSFAASEAAYTRRLAAGKQPLAPDFVRHAAGGALRFLDYTDTRAVVGANAAYLVLVAVLYVLMRRRHTGFALKGAMVVRRVALWWGTCYIKTHTRGLCPACMSFSSCDLTPCVVTKQSTASQVYNALCVCLAAYVVYGVAVYKLRHPGP